MSFKAAHHPENVTIDDYETIFSKTLENPTINCSRISVYVDKVMNKNIRSDLMSNTFSSVWLELGHPRQKNFFLSTL